MYQLKAGYSTIPGEELVGLLVNEYDLGQNVECRLWRRGFNDHYLVLSEKGQFFFRLYLQSRYWIKGEGDLRFELDLLRHLHSCGVNVAYPLPRSNGDILGRAWAPEGERYYALFTYAPGSVVSPFTEEQCCKLGQAMGRLHQAADLFETRHSRYQLDTTILLDLPLQRMKPYLEPEDYSYVGQVACEMKNHIRALSFPADGWGIIHADLHGRNCHLTNVNTVTFFDFDHCGYGWRAYDLAVFLWGKSKELQRAFLKGYGQARPLSDSELEAIPAFILTRAIWDEGDILAMVNLWGSAMAAGRRMAMMLKELRSLKEKYDSGELNVEI